jgi:integrase
MQFAKLARSVGMQGFRFHDLRRAFASITLADGVSIKEVQALIGHSSPIVTLSVYARGMAAMRIVPAPPGYLHVTTCGLDVQSYESGQWSSLVPSTNET